MYRVLGKILYCFDWLFNRFFADNSCYVCFNKIDWDNICKRIIICDSCLSEIKSTSPFLLKNRVKGVLVFSYGIYEGVLRKLLHAKYCKDPIPYYFLGKKLAEIIKKYNLNFDYIIPIPQSFFKFYSRGFNQSEELAKSISEEINVPILNAIKLDQFKCDQADLSIDERKKNINGKFKSSANAQKMFGKTICIVDDTYTTGSTIRAAIEAIRHSGVKKCFVFTVARCKKPCLSKLFFR
jgi:competence protein ComFC